MQELKRIGILSVAKLYALIGIILGLVGGIVIAILSAVAPEAISQITSLLPAYNYVLGYQAIIVLPIITGIKNFIVGIVGAWLYNVVAGWIGGVKVTLSGTETSTAKKSRR